MRAIANFDRVTSAFVGAGSTLNMAGYDLTLNATTTPTGPHALADIEGGSGGIGSVATYEAVATVGAQGGSTDTYIGTGSSVTARHVAMTATSNTEAKADLSYVGISLFFGVSVSSTLATAGHDTSSRIDDDATLTLSGNLTATANGTSTATPVDQRHGRLARAVDQRPDGLGQSDVEHDGADRQRRRRHGGRRRPQRNGHAQRDLVGQHRRLQLPSSTSTWSRQLPRTSARPASGSARQRSRGTWSSADVVYYEGDIVTASNGQQYTAKRSHVSSEPTDPALNNATTGAMWALGGGASGSSGNPTQVTATGAGGITADATAELDGQGRAAVRVVLAVRCRWRGDVRRPSGRHRASDGRRLGRCSSPSRATSTSTPRSSARPRPTPPVSPAPRSPVSR